MHRIMHVIIHTAGLKKIITLQSEIALYRFMHISVVYFFLSSNVNIQDFKVYLIA